MGSWSQLLRNVGLHHSFLLFDDDDDDDDYDDDYDDDNDDDDDHLWCLFIEIHFRELAEDKHRPCLLWITRWPAW